MIAPRASTWLAARPASLRTPYLFVEHGQRIDQGRVDRAVAKTAQAAGIGHVSEVPHRSRTGDPIGFSPERDGGNVGATKKVHSGIQGAGRQESGR